MDKAISSSNDISGASFLPIDPLCEKCEMNVAKTFKLNDLKDNGSITAMRLEGSKRSVDQRVNNLCEELKISDYNISIIENFQSEIFWRKIKKANNG